MDDDLEVEAKTKTNKQKPLSSPAYFQSECSITDHSNKNPTRAMTFLMLWASSQESILLNALINPSTYPMSIHIYQALVTHQAQMISNILRR